MGMIEIIIGIIIGILGVIGIFWCGYEAGKVKGLLNAEKLFDKVRDKAVNQK